ncbi:MAG: M14 family metallocarboxypeptidase [Terrimicrobiaceae bacterium]
MSKTLKLARQQIHNYQLLVRRWKRVANQAKLTWGILGTTPTGLEIVYLQNTQKKPNRPSLYLSAGIHGDEPAATEGLIEWAESATEFLASTNVLIFPCLNPWGLIWNSRLDEKGRDLNRLYHQTRVPQITAQKQVIAGRKFDLAMAMHEDYDATGIYLYEIPRKSPCLGEKILAGASKFLPVETRKTVEGRGCRAGLIRRDINPQSMTEHPEAFFLHFGHSQRTLTFETPSEFSIHDRVRAQISCLQTVQNFLLSLPPSES